MQFVAQQKDHEAQTEALHESMREVMAKIDGCDGGDLPTALRLRAEHSWRIPRLTNATGMEARWPL